MREVVNKVRQVAVKTLTRNVMTALENSTLQIEAQAMQFTNVQLPPIREESRTIAERFMTNLNEYFDALTTLKVKDTEDDDFGKLSLVDHDYLEAIIAMEGMVNHARNADKQEYISFTTRLDSVFPNLTIDETNNPLDPEQIGDCFNEAIRPMGLKAHYLLTIYREFNKAVFHNLEDMMAEANEVLIDLGIMPNLDMRVRNRELAKQKRDAERSVADAETQARSAIEASQPAPVAPVPVAPVAPAPPPAAPAPTPAPVAAPAPAATAIPAAEPSPVPAPAPAPAAERAIPAPSNKTEITRKIIEKVEEAKPKQTNAEIFAMMQTLVKGLADQRADQSALPIDIPVVTPAAPDQTANLQEENENLKQQQAKLMSVLNDIQSQLNLGDTISPSATSSGINNKTVGDSISRTLEEGSSSGEIGAIDVKSSDVINLVTLLYKAIWNDDSLPLVMKELIGRTQISIMKIALSDTDFFDDEQHPGRVILNELAMAGVAWTEQDKLENDPVFTKVRDLVERLLAETDADKSFLQGLINELRGFRNQFNRTDAALEQRIRETADHSQHLDDVHEFVRQKVRERVLRDDLDPSIQNLLNTHFHDFLVKLVLKEGPSGSSWKPVMSTIDVLLWTVKEDKLPGDKSRFEKINPRLLDNLEKALEIGGASKSKRTKVMRQLKQVQQYSFHMAESRGVERLRSVGGTDTNVAPARQHKEPPPLPRDDVHLRQIDKLPVGTWMEFKGVSGSPVRCTLAAKIESIDKLFFVNSQGENVVELTRMRLAQELKAGSVKIVSEGLLVDRAMESVISKLRDSASSQESDVAAS